MTNEDDNNSDLNPDSLAAEYVLGTLDAGEREQAQAMMLADAEFAASVRHWEKRLGALTAMVEPVQPPMLLWEKIRRRIVNMQPSGMPTAERRLDPSRSRAPEIAPFPQRVTRWRHAAIASGALAACLALFIGVQQFLPARMQTGTQNGRLVAVLQRDAASPGFLLTVDVAGKSFTLRKVGAETPPGRAYELWLISSQFSSPRSLGVVGEGDFTMRPITAYDRQTLDAATYAISLEPPGGSPTGAPTGPVVFTGKLIEAEPR